MNHLVEKKFAWLLPLWLLIGGFYLHWYYTHDRRPAGWDASVHLILADDYRNWVFKNKPLVDSRTSLYPPAYHFSLIPALAVSGPVERGAVWVNLVYLAILLLALQRIGLALGLTELEAFAATVLCSCYSLVVFLFHQTFIDYALMAWAAFTVAVLLPCQGFTRRSACIRFGLITGLGMLFKPTFPFFIALPVLWEMTRPLNESKSSRIRHAALSLLVAGLVCAPWYFWQNLDFVWRGFDSAVKQGVAQGDPDFSTLAGWLWYFKWMPFQMGTSALWITLVGLALAIFRYVREFRTRAQQASNTFSIVLAWVVSSYLGLTMIHNKDPRYDIGLLPALALLAAFGWTFLRPKMLRDTLVVVLLGVVLRAAVRYDPPRPEKWQHTEVGEILRAAHDPREPFLSGSVLANHIYFFGRTLRLSLRNQGIDFEPTRPGNPDADFTEFLLHKTGDLGSDSERVLAEWKDLSSQPWFSQLYKRLHSLALPDASVVEIYQRKLDHTFAVTPAPTRKELQSRLRNILAKQIQGHFSIEISGEPGDWRKGFVREFRLSGQHLLVKGAPIARATIVIKDARLNLYRLWSGQGPGLMALASIEPRIKIQNADMARFVEDNLHGLTGINITGRDGVLLISGYWRSWPVKAVARIYVNQKTNWLNCDLQWFRFGPLWLPGWILGKVRVQGIPLYPIPQFPGRILVRDILLQKDSLEII